MVGYKQITLELILVMANLSGKVVFQLLLILTLVFQPVMTAYAMASMPVLMQHDSAASKQGHDACHTMKQAMSDSQHDDFQGLGNSDMSDCCYSGACCSIAVFDATGLIFIPSLAFSAQLPVFWGDVILSSEFKPPRYLLS